MPDYLPATPIEAAWLNFTNSVRDLLVPQPEDRPLDQYLVFRDAVFALVQGQPFLMQLGGAWPPMTDAPVAEIGNALLLELQAFPLAAEVAKATVKPEESKGWWRKTLGRASTVSGSLKDLLDNLPPAVKGGLTLFNELIDVFKE